MKLPAATVHADTAKAMGNGMYSILLGLAIRGILVDPNLSNWPATLVALYATLITYYVLDWLSYNARIQLPKPMTHGELAGNVLSIVVFGSGINFCLRLLDSNGHLPTDPNWFVRVFQGFFFLYLILTTIGLLWVAKKEPFTSSSWQMVDVVLRAFVCAIGLMLWCWTPLSNRSPTVLTLLTIYSILAVILIGSKAFRYAHLFLIPTATSLPSPAASPSPESSPAAVTAAAPPTPGGMQP